MHYALHELHHPAQPAPTQAQPQASLQEAPHFQDATTVLSLFYRLRAAWSASARQLGWLQCQLEGGDTWAGLAVQEYAHIRGLRTPQGVIPRPGECLVCNLSAPADSGPSSPRREDEGVRRASEDPTRQLCPVCMQGLYCTAKLSPSLSPATKRNIHNSRTRYHLRERARIT